MPARAAAAAGDCVETQDALIGALVGSVENVLQGKVGVTCADGTQAVVISTGSISVGLALESDERFRSVGTVSRRPVRWSSRARVRYGPLLARRRA